MKDKIWEVKFNNSVIKVINKVSLFPPKTSEMLVVDGNLIKQVSGRFFSSISVFNANYTFDNVEKQIEVRIALKTGSLRTGAQIYVDGEFVGGDARIQCPNPYEMMRQYKLGYPRYFVTTGLIRDGLPFAIFMTLFNLTDLTLTTLWRFLFHMIFFGGFMSYLSWREIKSICKR